MKQATKTAALVGLGTLFVAGVGAAIYYATQRTVMPAPLPPGPTPPVQGQPVALPTGTEKPPGAAEPKPTAATLPPPIRRAEPVPGAPGDQGTYPTAPAIFTEIPAQQAPQPVDVTGQRSDD